MDLIIGLVSGAMFFGSIVAVVWLVRSLPEDYFVRPPPQNPIHVKVARNVLGATLVLAGVAMLVLPGQGLLTILIGLSVLDSPVKHRFIARLLERPAVLEAVQAMRRKAGRPPLVVPSHT